MPIEHELRNAFKPNSEMEFAIYDHPAFIGIAGTKRGGGQFGVLECPLLMQWTAPATGIAMCQIRLPVEEPRISAVGY